MTIDWNFLNQEYFGNPLQNYLHCVCILTLGFLFSKLIAKLFARYSYRLFKQVTRAQFHKEFITLFTSPFTQLVNLVVIYIAFNRITFPDAWHFSLANEFGLRWMLHTIFLIALIMVITRLFLKATEFMEYVYHNLEDATVSKDLASFLKELTRVLIYIFAFFAILAKAFEVNITALVTSLGIGGVAIALAAQDTLANLIGSFIIYLDKPFKVGDIVEIGDIRGVVEKIGFRTTRIRTLERSLLIVPNKKVVDANLTNITQSQQRRVKFNLALTYKSEPGKLLTIIEDIKAAILSEKPATDEEMTVRFSDFSESSLNLIVIYFVNSNEYEVMIEVKEKINLHIIEIVRKNGCEFAFPSQSIYLQNATEDK